MSDLYSDLQPQLVRILASNLQPPDWVIDEACQTAWSSLLEHGGAVVPGGELGWLSTTATRAALRLLRRERIAEPYDKPPVPVSLADFRIPEPEPEAHLELRERLAEIRRLPVRQQRVVMLHGFGYEYDEIAAVTGETRRTVARQLTRARQQLLRPANEG
ncbi:MAG: RNA polymerase sigma factor [Solirubrobacteraceae bacterium]